VKEFLYRLFGIKSAAQIEKDRIFHLRCLGLRVEGKSVFRCAGDCGEYGEHITVWVPQ
jgi:predicted metal-binding protein